jgi:drug/metabolite transporter (DMT)-like permease
VSTHPVFVALAEWAWLGRRPRLIVWVGIVLTLLGSAIIGWGDLQLGGQALYGDLLAVGGALALVLAARMSWGLVYLLMAGLIAVVALIAFRAPDTERPDVGMLHKELAEPGAVEPKARGVALAIVGVSWPGRSSRSVISWSRC